MHDIVPLPLPSGSLGKTMQWRIHSAVNLSMQPAKWVQKRSLKKKLLPSVGVSPSHDLDF